MWRGAAGEDGAFAGKECSRGRPVGLPCRGERSEVREKLIISSWIGIRVLNKVSNDE